MDTLIIIWAVVIAAALLLEFITYEFYTAWFAAGGLVALILAACEVSLEWQLIVFVVLSTALLVSLRPIVKKWVSVKTVPTNIDATIGKTVKLDADVVDGKSHITLYGSVWVALCNDNLKQGQEVTITGTDGNKYIVTKHQL